MLPFTYYCLSFLIKLFTFLDKSLDDSNLMMEDNNINTTASHHSDIISMISVPSTDLQIITTNETVSEQIMMIH